jgi:hypothetical protein
MFKNAKKVCSVILFLMVLSASVTVAQDVDLKKGLGMTPTQFMNAFNAFTKKSGIPINIPTITLNKGDVNDTFTHSFSENLAMVGVMQKADKKLLSLTMLGTPKTNDESNALFIIYGSIMAAVNPELSQERRGSLLTELVMDSSGGLAEENSAVRGATKYLFRADSLLGIQLYVTNVNEE